MNPMMKKIATGTLAVGLLAGGAGVYYSQAFAATDSSAPAADSQAAGKAPRTHGGEKGARGPFGGDFKRGGGGLVEQTATVLGVEASVIRDELKQQKTLAQIALDKANLSEDAFLQKLLDAEKTKLTEQVTAGKLTQAQADERIAGLSERIQKEITAVGGSFDGKGGGHGGQPGKGGFPGGGRGGFGPFGSPEALSSALGLTKDELSAALKEGKSLTEIAADKGIDKDQLVSKIKDSLDEPIRQFIDRKHTGKEQPPAPASGTATDATSGAGA
ncbi:hypothetical protein WMW72_15460 [Paenibacillus filicis]|uniref:Uncharacterized protein n=1 Tax=Paenibacillus filicis TaxID=669464 RepID=A0ABU9DMH8_9BACL